MFVQDGKFCFFRLTLSMWPIFSVFLKIWLQNFSKMWAAHFKFPKKLKKNMSPTLTFDMQPRIMSFHYWVRFRSYVKWLFNIATIQWYEKFWLFDCIVASSETINSPLYLSIYFIIMNLEIHFFSIVHRYVLV